MKQKAKRSTARTRAKRTNPRYLISRDGVELGIYPGFTSVEAVKRAKAQYGRGTYTAEKIGADMYLGRGGEDIAASERLERQQEYRAHRLSKAKRNPRNLATKEEMMRIIMSRKLDVHPYPRGKYPYTVDWKFRDGKIFAIEFPDRTALVDSQYLPRRNGTHIHAENIDHLDVSKVHNPNHFNEFVAVSYFSRANFADDVTFLPLSEPYNVEQTFDTIAAYKGAGAHTFSVYQGIGENEYGEPEQFQRLNKHVVINTIDRTIIPIDENPARPVRRMAYTLGTWWQPFIEYGDDSDVSIEEIAQWNAFRKRLEPGGHWSFNEDTYFGKDDVTGKRGDVSDAVYVIVG